MEVRAVEVRAVEVCAVEASNGSWKRCVTKVRAAKVHGIRSATRSSPLHSFYIIFFLLLEEEQNLKEKEALPPANFQLDF